MIHLILKNDSFSKTQINDRLKRRAKIVIWPCGSFCLLDPAEVKQALVWHVGTRYLKWKGIVNINFMNAINLIHFQNDNELIYFSMVCKLTRSFNLMWTIKAGQKEMSWSASRLQVLWGYSNICQLRQSLLR